ncbi:unnamed protein product, partial [marine sediment metagenome]
TIKKTRKYSGLYKKQPTYNPIMEKIDKDKIRPQRSRSINTIIAINCKSSKGYDNTIKYPGSVLSFSSRNAECNYLNRLHPTQKPVTLFEYLIKIYTNEANIVLDNCMGSGTTAIACIKLDRHYIGFEINKEYYDIANKRLENLQLELIK